MTSPTSTLLSAREVGALLRVSKSTVYQMHAQGLIPPCVRLSLRRMRWTPESIEHHIKMQTQGASRRQAPAVPERPAAQLLPRPRRARAQPQPSVVDPLVAS